MREQQPELPDVIEARFQAGLKVAKSTVREQFWGWSSPLARL